MASNDKSAADSSGRSTNPERDETPDVDPSTVPSAQPEPPAPAASGLDGTVPAVGQVLAGRWKLSRFIASGGMGSVFEAEDLRLGERVALKTLRARIADRPGGEKRFRREILLARRVTHPNVCRIFEFGEQGQLQFLTMELLEGETLSARLRRAGRMSEVQALPLVRQMVAALAAAHEAEVVHRDFKCSNVLLVPRRDGSGAVLHERVVVTDFGLARTSDEAIEATLSLAGRTATGRMLGTPEYMAPEQVEGRAVTAATDVYALGIVLYEMLTGTRPFVGETPLSTALKRMLEPPASPRQHVAAIDPRWEAAILRCLCVDPAERFQRVRDLLQAIEPGADGAPTAPSRRRSKRLPVAFGVAALFLVGLGGLATIRWPTGDVEEQRGDFPQARRAVAVLGFKNLTGRPQSAWLSTALAEMLSSELAASRQLRVLPGESIARMKLELQLAESESYAADTLARIRTNLGADLVVTGSFLALEDKEGGALRFDLRFQDTKGGETLAAVVEKGSEAELFQLVSNAGRRLREELGLEQRTHDEAAAVQASLPQDPQAARLYAEGLDLLRRFEAQAALEPLQRAAGLASGHPLPHAALSEAYQQLGAVPRAKAEAQTAFELAGPLSRPERLLLEGRAHETAFRLDQAIEIYRSLRLLYPDNLDYGLRLGTVQLGAGRGREALATLGALRKLPPPDGEDPRIDLTAALAALRLSDYKEGLRLVAAAAAKGRARGMRLVVARARHLEAWALLLLGRLPEAVEAAEEARQIFADAGDRDGVAAALDLLGNLLHAQGRFAAGLRHIQESLQLARSTGSLRVIPILTDSAVLLADLGRLDAARRQLEEAIALARSTSERDAIPLQSLASVLARQGQLAAAAATFEEAIGKLRSSGDRRMLGHAIAGRGELALAAGDLGSARQLLDESLETFRQIGHRSYMARALERTGRLLAATGDLAGARRRLDEAIALRTELGELGRCADTRLALATVALAEGQASEAESLARQSIPVFEAEQRRDEASLAQALLGLALHRTGRGSEAVAAVEQARRLAAGSESPLVQLTAELAWARVRAATEAPLSLRAAEEALERAGRLGLVGVQLEARLVLGEAELASGNTKSGQTRLAALRDEAARLGFRLIARQSEAALGR